MLESVFKNHPATIISGYKQECLNKFLKYLNLNVKLKNQEFDVFVILQVCTYHLNLGRQFQTYPLSITFVSRGGKFCCTLKLNLLKSEEMWVPGSGSKLNLVYRYPFLIYCRKNQIKTHDQISYIVTGVLMQEVTWRWGKSCSRNICLPWPSCPTTGDMWGWSACQMCSRKKI